MIRANRGNKALFLNSGDLLKSTHLKFISKINSLVIFQYRIITSDGQGD